MRPGGDPPGHGSRVGETRENSSVRSPRSGRRLAPTPPPLNRLRGVVGPLGAEDNVRPFAVRLVLDAPAETITTRYMVVGQDPLWVFRQEDYRADPPLGTRDGRRRTRFGPGAPDRREDPGGNRGAERWTLPMGRADRRALRVAPTESTPRSAHLEDRPRTVATHRGLRRRVPHRRRMGSVSGYWARLTSVATPTATISSDTEYFCPDGPRSPLGLALEVPDLQHDARPAQAGRIDAAARRGLRADAIHAVPALAGRHPHRVGRLLPARRRSSPPVRVASVSGARSEVEAHFFGREMVWVGAGELAEVRPLGEGSSIALPAKVKNVPPTPVAPGESGGSWWRSSAGRGGSGSAIMFESWSAPRSSGPSRPGACRASRRPSSPGEPRRLYSCMEHPDVVRDAPGRCPRNQAGLMARGLDADPRVRWWCPMHPEVTADRPGSMRRVRRDGPRPASDLVRPPGKVLGVPSSAVIEDGCADPCLRQADAGIFDARAVLLGPRCGDHLPGRSAAWSPATVSPSRGRSSSIAETRLNPSLAAGYFGAGGAPGRERGQPRGNAVFRGAGCKGYLPIGLAPSARRPARSRTSRWDRWACRRRSRPGSGGLPLLRWLHGRGRGQRRPSTSPRLLPRGDADAEARP